MIFFFFVHFTVRQLLGTQDGDKIEAGIMSPRKDWFDHFIKLE